MGKALHSMRPGDKIEIKGPFGSFKYQPGKYKAIGKFFFLLCLLKFKWYCTWYPVNGAYCIPNDSSYSMDFVLCFCAGLLAGGMGVTPMINLSHVILKNPNDKVKVGANTASSTSCSRTPVKFTQYLMHVLLLVSLATLWRSPMGALVGSWLLAEERGSGLCPGERLLSDSVGRVVCS